MHVNPSSLLQTYSGGGSAAASPEAAGRTSRGQPGPGVAAGTVAGPRVEELLPAAIKPKGAAPGGASVVSLSPDALSAMAQKTLETRVGEEIAAAFAEAGVDLSEGVGQDWSVDATAKRIADFSTGLYGIFREQHADLDDDEALSLFEETIRGAVDRGYGEAVQVLEGMSVSEDILGQAEATVQRVHELFDEFFTAQREPEAATESPEEV